MKRAIWAVLMLLLSGTLLLPSTSVDASAFQSCLDKACNRDLDCLVECDACDSPSPILPGNCTI